MPCPPMFLSFDAQQPAKMKNGRNQTDVLSIERTLGLKSERGVSRQGNKESPPIEAILKGIKNIMVAYVNQDLTVIRDSDALKADATALFDTHGPHIWPAPDEPRPLWLEEPSESRYDGKYPKARHFAVPEDYEYLKERFIQLVIEKSCNYHENQLQKHRRHTAKALQTHLAPEHDADSPQQHHHHPHSDLNRADPHMPLVSKMDEFHSQFAAYTQPVPDEDIKPPGLPTHDGAYAQPGSAKKRQRTITNVDENGAPKRARSESLSGSSLPEESLVVRLSVGEQALARLAVAGKVQSAYGFQAINNLPARKGSEPPRVHGFNPVNATPARVEASTSALPASTKLVTSPLVTLLPSANGKTSPPTNGIRVSPVLASNGVHGSPRGPPPSLTGLGGSSATEGPRPEHRRNDASERKNYESPYHPHLAAQGPPKHEQFRPAFHAVTPLPTTNSRPPVAPLPSPAMHNPFRTFPPSGPPLGPPPAFGAPHQMGPAPAPPPVVNPLRQHVPLPDPILSALGLQGPGPNSRARTSSLRRPGSSGQRRPSATSTLSSADTVERREYIQQPVSTPDPLDQDVVFFEDVLGELAFCPVVLKLKEELGAKMPRHRLEKLKKLLVDFPDARFELEALERRARMPPDQYEAERIPPPGWIQNPVGVYVPAPLTTQYSFSHAHSYGRDAALTPRHTPGPPPHAKPEAQLPPLTQYIKEEYQDLSSSGRSLNNILVEVNWNRNLDYSDHMEMHEFDTVQQLFDMVDEARPDELLTIGEGIKEIRIKPKTALRGAGGQVLPRIVHDEVKGRAGLKQLIRRLRSQPEDMEIELLFEVMWKNGEGQAAATSATAA